VGHNTLTPYNTIEVDITNTIAAPAPIILVHDGHFGIRQAGLASLISASLGQTITVEASSNLAAWFPLATSVLATNTLYYADPLLPSQPRRFYRLRSP